MHSGDITKFDRKRGKKKLISLFEYKKIVCGHIAISKMTKPRRWFWLGLLPSTLLFYSPQSNSQPQVLYTGYMYLTFHNSPEVHVHDKNVNSLSVWV